MLVLSTLDSSRISTMDSVCDTNSKINELCMFLFYAGPLKLKKNSKNNTNDLSALKIVKHFMFEKHVSLCKDCKGLPTE